MSKIQVQDLHIGEGAPFTVISGPCVIEGRKEALYAAEFLAKFFEKRRINFIFKSSYDKANRTSVHSYRGPGLEEGLSILQEIKEKVGCYIFTDVHTPEEATAAGQVCDIIQIPAFLCRQTDLVVAAAKSGAAVNIKKGQFMAPWDMEHVIEKIRVSGNNRILLTERGTSFGYNNLVSDMRSIAIMKKFQLPVIYDVTHSVQLPGGLGSSSGGQRDFIPTLANAAIAAGAHGIYAESHPNPPDAKSDAATMIYFKDLPKLVDQWEKIYEAVSAV